ncbi:MAG: squalene/phytoene synthase family protein [Planctomycetia bacterium]|nr:squalene/phytoene synthase family protein [Planctomycetia bacterium]
MNTLAADHAACAEALKKSGSSFALPIRLLPEAKRRGTTALYAFCRIADDLVDDAADEATASSGLAAFSAATEAALAGHAVEDPVLRAVADTVRRFAIPATCLRDILAGVRMDLTQRRYATFGDLERYCSRVASAVGVAAIHVWGYTDPEAIVLSHDCGIAFQLTNILRDIPEDLGRERIYLPHEDFAACGCMEDDLVAGRLGPGFTRLAALEVERAAGFYARAAAIDGMLSTDGRGVFRAMFGLYRSMLAAVRRTGPGIFTSRVRPSRPRLLAAAAATLLCGTRSLR